MRALGVVLDAPRFDEPAGMAYGQEPMLVQTLIAELAVETFDLGILIRLPRSNER